MPPTAAMPYASHPRKAIAIVWLTVFIDLVGFSIIFPIFPAMLDWYLSRGGDASMLGGVVESLRNITPQQNQHFLITVLFGGLLGSLYSLLQFVASPVWGRLSDIHGRRNILLITTSGTAIAYLIWIFSGSFWVLILSRLLGGFMAGNIAVATAAVADLTSVSNRAKGMALIGLAFGLGFILGPAIGGFGSLVVLPFDADSTAAISLTPFSFPALLALLLACINVVWVWRAFPETHNDRENPGTAPKRPLFAFGSKIPDVRLALRIYLLFIFAFAAMEFTLTFLALERLFYQPRDMAKMFVFIGLSLALTQGLVVRRLSHRVGERNFVIIGMLSSFLGLIVLSISIDPTRFYAGLALLGFGVGCSSPSLTTLVSRYSPPQHQGAQLGIFRSIGSLGRAFGPICGALAFWAFGSQIAYLSGAVLLAAAAILAIVLPQPPADPASPLPFPGQKFPAENP